MNNHKLSLNQYSDNYHLIAIHSNLEEYRLAFFLNEKLNINLKRKNNDISLNETKANYSVYEYLEEAMYLKWIFFSNKSLVSEASINEALNLFNQESFVQNEICLINQPKGVDYFLIIENGVFGFKAKPHFKLFFLIVLIKIFGGNVNLDSVASI